MLQGKFLASDWQNVSETFSVACFRRSVVLARHVLSLPGCRVGNESANVILERPAELSS